MRVKVFRCKKCSDIIRKLSYSVANKKLKSGYTNSKTITTNYYLCINPSCLQEVIRI